MDSTLSAGAQNMSQVDLISFFSHPLVIVIISSGVVAFIFKFVFNLGGKNKEIDSALTSIESLKKDVKKLLSHMDKVVTHLVNKTGLDSGLFSSASPVSLLPKGRAVLEKSGFKKTYEDNKGWFIDEIKKLNVKTLSDIDEASQRVIGKCIDEKKFVNYKEIAFQNGLPIDVLLRILSIYLRDEVSKEILEEISQ